MDSLQVEELAHHEQRMSAQGAEPGRPSSTSMGASGRTLTEFGAYQPLAGGPSAGHAASTLDVCQIRSSGTVLIVRFRWRPGSQERDLFLHLNFADYRGNLDGASVRLLEFLQQRLIHDVSWFPDRIEPLSAHAAVVLLADPPSVDCSR